MIVHGRASLHEVLGDFVAYRSLQAFDARLHPTSQHADGGLGFAPRKCDLAYGAAVVNLLTRARAIEPPHAPLRHLLYVGDSHVNDVAAFRSIAAAAGWPGIAFIGNETSLPTSLSIEEGDGEVAVISSNRWLAVADLDRLATNRGIPIDASTAVIVDIDKTVLGARGRNDAVIDSARRSALRHTLAALLGTRDDVRIDEIYDDVNQVDMHPLTGDNQDAVAYVTLMVASEGLSIQTLQSGLEDGSINGFDAVLSLVNDRIDKLQLPLQSVHKRVLACRIAGDPTPFKAFRRREYIETIARMGNSTSTSAHQVLSEEIVITQEVWTSMHRWKDQGALLFGLSDKPDEACHAAGDSTTASRQPIHRAVTHSVGMEEGSDRR